MIGVTVIFVVGSVVLQIVIGFAIAWLIDAGRRRRRARHSRRAPRRRQRLGDPRRPGRRDLEDPADREPIGIVNYYLGQAGLGPLRSSRRRSSRSSRWSSPTSGAGARSA
jgi:hypothetical protein